MMLAEKYPVEAKRLVDTDHEWARIDGEWHYTDRFIEDGSYLRIKNVSIGYTFSSEGLKAVTNNVISRVRVYVSSQNLLTFTKYTGFDPEVASRGYNLLNNGIDYGQYPQARTVLFGVNLGFN